MDLCVFDGVGVALDNMKYQHPGAHGAVIFFSIKYTKNTERRGGALCFWHRDFLNIIAK